MVASNTLFCMYSKALPWKCSPPLLVAIVMSPSCTLVAATILRIARRKSAQPVRGEQMLANFLDYAFCPISSEHTVGSVSYTHLTLPTNREV